MSKIKLYSNFVNKANAVDLDDENQKEEILATVKQAIENGVKEIYFNYEEGPVDTSPRINADSQEACQDQEDLRPWQQVVGRRSASFNIRSFRIS